MNNCLTRFKKAKISALIVDLRDGFGGADPDYLKTLTHDPFYTGLSKVFLINGGVRSGKEWLAAIVKRDHLGRLVGSKTAGAFMGGEHVKLPDNRYFLYVAVKEFNPPDIPPIEGLGIEADDAVADCQHNCEGQDPPLQHALDLLAKSASQ
jgi:carboxyl-terminal processing protease